MTARPVARNPNVLPRPLLALLRDLTMVSDVGLCGTLTARRLHPHPWKYVVLRWQDNRWQHADVPEAQVARLVELGALKERSRYPTLPLTPVEHREWTISDRGREILAAKGRYRDDPPAEPALFDLAAVTATKRRTD